MNSKLIEEINLLSKISKERTLSIEEKKRQSELRTQYLEEFKKNMRSQIENIVVVENDGSFNPIKRRS